MKARFKILFVVLTFGLAGCIEMIKTALENDFGCSSFLSCHQCIMSSVPCDWCLESHRCVHNTDENCRNGIFVFNSNRSQKRENLDQIGPEFCPSISLTENETEISIPSGQKKSIKMKAHINRLSFIIQTRFVCQFNIDGRVFSSNAQLLGDTIYCDSMTFEYTSTSPNLAVPMAVLWGGSRPLDNPDGVQVVIYKCRYMANTCDECVALNEKYNCGWCHTTSSCEIADQCTNGNVTNKSSLF